MLDATCVCTGQATLQHGVFRPGIMCEMCKQPSLTGVATKALLLLNASEKGDAAKAAQFPVDTAVGTDQGKCCPVQVEDSISQYKYYISTDGKPLRLHMMGAELALKSHFDEYILNFHSFEALDVTDEAPFQVPDACAGAQLATAPARSSAALLASLIPNVRNVPLVQDAAVANSAADMWSCIAMAVSEPSAASALLLVAALAEHWRNACLVQRAAQLCTGVCRSTKCRVSTTCLPKSRGASMPQRRSAAAEQSCISRAAQRLRGTITMLGRPSSWRSTTWQTGLLQSTRPCWATSATSASTRGCSQQAPTTRTQVHRARTGQDAGALAGNCC